MRLPPWDWKNPFGISTEKLDHYGERKEEVVSLLDKCGLKHTQLEIIWNRLGDDIDAFESHLDLIDKYARLGGATRDDPLSS